MPTSNPISSASTGKGYWVALQVKPNHERAAAEHLAMRDCEYYLPLLCGRRQWSDRVKQVESPLFPGYLFCRYEPKRRAAILSTFGVLRILGYGRDPALVSTEELEAIQRLTSSGLTYERSHYLHVGHRVRVRFGPLAGLEGLITGHKKGRVQFAVSVTLLHRSVTVDIDRTWLDSCETHSHDQHVENVVTNARSLCATP